MPSAAFKYRIFKASGGSGSRRARRRRPRQL